MKKLSAVVVIPVIFSIAIAAFMPVLAAENEAPNAMISYSYSLLGGKVTGGGWILSPVNPDEKATFGLHNLQFHDHATGMNVHSESIKELIVSEDGKEATITGTARVDGISGYSYTVEVEDKGEPGWKKGDTFAISIPELDYTASGTLGNGEHGGGNIKIHDEPVEAPTTNQPIVFDASQSYDLDGNIVEYIWDFGDDSPIQQGNIAEITHSYADEGDYTVTLTVVDDTGATDVATITVTVDEEGTSGNVILEAVTLSVPEDKKKTIGEPIEITGSVRLNNTGATENVTVVEICVDGDIIYQEDTTLLPGEVKTIDDISVEWYPMSSGMHRISLQVRDVVEDDEGNQMEYWIGPTNDLSAEVKVHIKKAK